jgi:hypothetical protein
MINKKEFDNAKNMKAILAIAVSVTMASAAYGVGGGALLFNNIRQTGTITIGPYSHAGEGTVGYFPGSDYNVSLFFSISPISGPVDPLSLTLYSPSTVAFYGTTGTAPNHGPTVDGAGVFDGSSTASVGPGIPGTTDGQIIYVEAAVWYNGAGATDYASAEALGYNICYSQAISVRIATGPDPVLADMSAMPSFEVGIVPEPSTIVLGGLGAAAMLLLRRRK